MQPENTTSKQKDKKELVTSAGKEAFLMWQNMQAQANVNVLQLGARVVEKPEPNNWTAKDGTPNTYYYLVFGFIGGTIKEKVTSDLYHKASIGSSYLLEGYIKSTGDKKTFGEKDNEREVAVVTLNPAITKITPLDTLTAFGYEDSEA